MDVPDLSITWSHTYTSDDIVAVPGFTTSFPSLFSTGVYVQVALTPKGKELRLTVGWYFIWNLWSVTTSDFREPRQTRSQSFSSLRKTLGARSNRKLFLHIMSLAMNANFATSKYF